MNQRSIREHTGSDDQDHDSIPNGLEAKPNAKLKPASANIPDGGVNVRLDKVPADIKFHLFSNQPSHANSTAVPSSAVKITLPPTKTKPEPWTKIFFAKA